MNLGFFFGSTRDDAVIYNPMKPHLKQPAGVALAGARRPESDVLREFPAPEVTYAQLYRFVSRVFFGGR